MLAACPPSPSSPLSVVRVMQVHGTTMLGAIIGQVLLFNVLGSFLELGAINYIATALCGGYVLHEGPKM